ncbi:MAG: hypothetical protein GY797_24925 [Deltaproteobacteria bacterium]|nr:hypothetical protein [Deltaproteobacteria bacterium]
MEIAELVLEYVRVLIWPAIILIIVLIFRKQLHTVINRLEKAGLPGGVSFDFREEIKEAKRLADKVEALPPSEDITELPTIPLTEVNARLISLGLRPSPSGLDTSYYRSLAMQHPNLALTGVRIEADIVLRNLAQGSGIIIEPKDTGRRLAKKLADAKVIRIETMQLITKILELANLATHGQIVISLGEANSILDSVDVLIEQYVRWLSWGFDSEWKPSSSN